MTAIKWKRGDHKRAGGLARFWTTADGRWSIWQGRPDGAEFVYELEAPDGTTSLLKDVKGAAYEELDDGR